MRISEIRDKAMKLLSKIAEGTYWKSYGSSIIVGHEVKRGPHLVVYVPVEIHPDRLTVEEMDQINDIINEHVDNVSTSVTYSKTSICTGNGDFWQVSFDIWR